MVYAITAPKPASYPEHLFKAASALWMRIKKIAQQIFEEIKNRARYIWKLKDSPLTFELGKFAKNIAELSNDEKSIANLKKLIDIINDLIQKSSSEQGQEDFGVKESTHPTLKSWAKKLAKAPKQHAPRENLEFALYCLNEIINQIDDPEKTYQSIYASFQKTVSFNIFYRILFNIGVQSYEMEKLFKPINQIYQHFLPLIKRDASRREEAPSLESPDQDCDQQKTSELALDKKEYKKAALEIHPDRYQSEEDKGVADKLFKCYLSLYAQKNSK